MSGGIEQLAGGANNLLQNVLGRVTHAALDLGLFLLMLFFLLRDGGRLRAELQPISPFSEEQERQIFDHLERTIQGALQAVVVVPVVQGILAGIGFMMFGVPQPFVWGTAVILAATVPLVGSPLGWIPACLYLALKGQTGPALGLLVYSAVIVSGSDNVIKPMLLQGSARIHPLLGLPVDHRRRARVRDLRLPDRAGDPLARPLRDPHLPPGRPARGGHGSSRRRSVRRGPICNGLSRLGLLAGLGGV